jgi:transposase
MSSKYDYTGKTIYVGMDVHKNSYSVTVTSDKAVVKKDRLVASPTELVCYLKNNFRGAKINTAYEAGFSGFHLHRCLIQHGINNIVVHPAAIEIAARERVKTDKRDALKISAQLADGKLHCIHIPDEKVEANRRVTRLRSSLMEDRTKYGNRIKALLFQYGLIAANDDTIVSKKWIDETLKTLKKKKFSDGLIYTVQSYSDQWVAIATKVKEINKELIKQAEGEKKIDDIYRSVPGIGPLSARILANELGDMKQFSGEKKFFSFTGLTPMEYSSGDKKCLGCISRQGRPVLRKILIEAAWVAIKKDKNLETIFEAIAKRAGKKRAIVAVARRLSGRIRACVIKGEKYKFVKNVK